MKKISVLTGIGFAAVLGASAPAMAQTVSSVTVQDVVQSAGNEALAQRITSVNDMTDVKPTDWAYGALQSLTDIAVSVAILTKPSVVVIP